MTIEREGDAHTSKYRVKAVQKLHLDVVDLEKVPTWLRPGGGGPGRHSLWGLLWWATVVGVRLPYGARDSPWRVGVLVEGARVGDTIPMPPAVYTHIFQNRP